MELGLKRAVLITIQFIQEKVWPGNPKAPSFLILNALCNGDVIQPSAKVCVPMFCF